jgi:hypothetical protein
LKIWVDELKITRSRKQQREMGIKSSADTIVEEAEKTKNTFIQLWRKKAVEGLKIKQIQ